MTEKKKIQKKRETCIDCDCETDDFYKIPTNRGNIVKCANCYELWILRSTRIINSPLLKNVDQE